MDRMRGKRGLTIAVLIAVAAAGAMAAVAALRDPAIKPIAWRPVPALPVWSERLGHDRTLDNPRRFECYGSGPESVAVNSRNGDLATGFSDGWVHLITKAGGASHTVGRVEGQALGLGFLADSSLVVADTKRGLVRIQPRGRITVLADASENIRIRYADGLVVNAGGRFVYFSDASARRTAGEDVAEIVEHRGSGRLLRYDTATGKTSTLLSGLEFANGVALGPNDAYVLVSETSAYRIRQYWLSGPLEGRSRIFADGLPGLPDNVTFDGRATFWVALHDPRFAYLDTLAGYPVLRKMLLPIFARFVAATAPSSRVVGLDLTGKPVANLEGHGKDAYAPVTEAHAVGARLILGSDAASCLAWVPRPPGR